MANEIRVDYQQLAQIANKFAQQSQLLVEMQQRIEKALQALQNGSWQGRGSVAFFSEMNGAVSPAVQRLYSALEQAQHTTLEINSLIRDAEQDAALPFRVGSGETMSGNSSENSGNTDGLWSRFGEWVHTGLDGFGLVPGVGEIADGANALIYLAEGRELEAAISAAAMIPVVGDLGKAGKYAAKAGKEILEEGAEKVAKKGVSELTTKISIGKQGKHVPGHNNFREGRSILTANPDDLTKFAGTGTQAGQIPRGKPGFKRARCLSFSDREVRRPCHRTQNRNQRWDHPLC